MNRFAFLIGVMALSSTALTQTYTTSPKGFDFVEGNSDAYTLGMYAAGRYMTFDAEQIGSAMMLKGIAYRADNRMHTTATAMGRTWSNVKIWASDCNMSSLSYTFTANPTTTPSKVFDASMDWQTVTGKPAKLPADWTLQFPFATNWSYSGTQGICLDFVFTGGTLANNAAWPSVAYYYKDTENPSQYAYITSTPLGLFGNKKGCNDRGVTHLSGASLSTTAYFYSDTYSSANYRGRLKFDLSGTNFGPSRQVFTLLGFGSNLAGTPFPGVYCNKLHVDATLPVVLLPAFTSGSGTYTMNFTGQYGVKADASVGGLELVTQAAWADSVNQNLLMSSAAKLIVPFKPTSYTHGMLYNANSSATTGNGPYYTAAHNAIVRYTK